MNYTAQNTERPDRSRKTNTAFKKGILSGYPFLLYAAGIFLLIWGLFIIFVVHNPLYGLAFDPISPNGGEGLSVMSPQPPDANEGSSFYVPEDFPVIYFGDQWAKLTIESIDVRDYPVVFGDLQEYLRNNVGHFTGSRFCGQHGNIVLSGHVTTPFSKLENIEIGATVLMDTIYGPYEYEVTETKIFDQDDESMLLPDDSKEKLTIYTCYPRDNRGNLRVQRFAAICRLVSGYDYISGQQVTEDAGQASDQEGGGDQQ